MLKIPIVLNTERAGFGLTDAIVAELRRRNCTWVSKFKRGDLMKLWFAPRSAQDEARRDPVLVDIVRAFEREWEELPLDMPWRDRTALEERLLHGLRVVEVTVELDIDEYNGRESVRVRGGVW
jgi:hypothetical protein